MVSPTIDKIIYYEGLNRFTEILVYETQSRFYLVASAINKAKFTILKIDRQEKFELNFSDGGHEYDAEELNELLTMVSSGNLKQHGSSSTGSNVMTPKVKSFGLVGFVKFLQGYYMILITKCSRAALLGYHYLYKIDDTIMIYIPNTTDEKSNSSKTIQLDEQRYLRTFQSIDLNSNFYFSYTYDISRSLQENVIALANRNGVSVCDDRFVWNQYQLQPLLLQNASQRWILPIIHGSIGCRYLSVYCSTYCLMLIGRRSRFFAGTRFLKRGASFEGNVANEVESEQIFFQTDIASFQNGLFASYVQHRGSVPIVWTQDQNKTVAKPPIEIQLADPYASIAAAHFAALKKKYSCPIVVISLVKKKEKRPQEQELNSAFYSSVAYLNQFLEPEDLIYYLNFDMARCLKSGRNVIAILETIGLRCVEKHGWFQSFAPFYCHKIRPHPRIRKIRAYQGGYVSDCVICHSNEYTFVKQRGVSRFNCVDCLDRTNTAQFAFGKVALGFQIYAMGLCDAPIVDTTTEICRLLEQLYEEQGDNMAMQYAGSQLVHGVKTYQKKSAFHEKSRDVIQTLSRYYSSTFSAADKQSALNLFLGVYEPSVFISRGIPHLWDMTTDVYLHNRLSNVGPSAYYCAWYDRLDNIDKIVERPIARGQQLSYFDQFYKPWELTSFDALIASQPKSTLVQSFYTKSQLSTSFINRLLRWQPTETGADNLCDAKTATADSQAESSDSSSDDDTTLNQLSNSTAQPKVTIGNNNSHGGGSSVADPDMLTIATEGSMFGSMMYADVGSCSDSVSPLPYLNVDDEYFTNAASFQMKDIMPSMEDVYGCTVSDRLISDKDIRIYQQFERLSIKPDELEREGQLISIAGRDDPVVIEPLDDYKVEPNWMPYVSDESIRIYEESVNCSMAGPRMPNTESLRLYKSYTQNRSLCSA